MKFVGISLLVLLAYVQAKDLRTRNESKENMSFLKAAMHRSTQENIFPCPGDSAEAGWDIKECKCPDGTVRPWDMTEDPCAPEERPDPCWCTDGTGVSMIDFVNNFQPDNSADTNHALLKI